MLPSFSSLDHAHKGAADPVLSSERPVRKLARFYFKRLLLGQLGIRIFLSCKRSLLSHPVVNVFLGGAPLEVPNSVVKLGIFVDVHHDCFRGWSGPNKSHGNQAMNEQTLAVQLNLDVAPLGVVPFENQPNAPSKVRQVRFGSPNSPVTTHFIVGMPRGRPPFFKHPATPLPSLNPTPV